jgi:nucleotide-binding universal stress UspA family protein
MRLLIAASGSKYSEDAVRFGGHVAVAIQAQVEVLVVLSGKLDETRAEEIHARARDLLSEFDLAVESRQRRGNTADEILKQARESGANLLILGQSQAPNLVERVLGQTVEKVIAEAPCPVMVAKGKVAPINRILLCDSGAYGQELIERFVTRFKGLLASSGEVTVLHVMSQMVAKPGLKGWELRADAETLIQAHTPEGDMIELDLKDLKRLNTKAVPKVRHGLVVEEILSEAREGDYDLIVIGAHQSAGWQRFLLDDLARQIATQAVRPVLILK